MLRPEALPYIGRDGDDSKTQNCLPVANNFQVSDAASANWVVRKIIAARHYAEGVERWAETELRKAKREEEWLLIRFGRCLQDWLLKELGRESRSTRSINLPAGRIGLRAKPACLKVVDSEAVISWCREHLTDAISLRISVSGEQASLVRQKLSDLHTPVEFREDVLMEPLQGHFKQTGELPDGMIVSNTTENFYVR